MAAGLPARDLLLEEIPNMRTTIGNMSDSITHLHTLLAGLMEDPMGDYEGDGPAIRARQYLHALDSDRLRFDQLMDKVENLDSVITELSTTTYNNAEHLENELTNMRTEMGAARSRGDSPPYDRRNKNITETKGFEKLKPYTGDPTQWKDWRFKVTTWLTQTNPSFESLMIKLDKSENEPKEPEEGHKMMAGSRELTTEEEWCSEQLY